jgi:hypothetical protein
VDRADRERPGCNEFGKPAALRSGICKIQSLCDAAFEHGEMVGQRQDGLHHVQVVDSRWIDIRQGGGEKIGLLLIVAFDRYAVARLDDRFEQQRRLLGGANFPTHAAERGASCEAGGAVGCASCWVLHV